MEKPEIVIEYVDIAKKIGMIQPEIERTNQDLSRRVSFLKRDLCIN